MFLIRFFFVGNNEKLNTKPFNIPFSFPPNFPEIGFYTEETTFFVTNGACDQIEQIKRRSGKKSFIFVASHVGLKCLKCTRYNDVILNKSKFFQIDYITTITMCQRFGNKFKENRFILCRWQIVCAGFLPSLCTVCFHLSTQTHSIPLTLFNISGESILIDNTRLRNTISPFVQVEQYPKELTNFQQHHFEWNDKPGGLGGGVQ